MRQIAFALTISLLPTAALADMCPALPDRSEEISDLMAQLKASPSAQSAQWPSAALWEIWLTAPDARAQELLDDGTRHLRYGEFVSAEGVLDTLVDYCPDYAEGWNQRAFAKYLQKDFSGALSDLERALTLNPQHLGALSGQALSLIGLGDMEAAQDVLRGALELNPWLPERRYLAEPKGTDL